mmetsp:Transcript_12403/g.19085  ORF Transcript_12403/g.19085 Transcript_12403/m.19085 type:complete len:464 (-) Transcript_12403:1998-3389(-)
MMALLVSRTQVFLGICLSLAAYSIIYQYFMIFRPDEHDVENVGPLPLPVVYDRHYLEQLQLPNSYQCAMVWLRLPKTASTTVIRRFVSPFVKNANLQHVELGPNTCVTHIGGCTDLWQGWETNKSQWAGIDGHSIAPPYGVSSYNSNRISRSDGNNQRCFPDKGAKTKLYCWEFDSNHSTLFYGPHHFAKRKKRKQKKIKPSTENNTFTTANFDLYPSLHTHVAIDTSLFGWILPQTPMVISTFRDPVDRLLSSFHYGIQFGGGPPGLVRKCRLPGVKDLNDWQSRIITAREVAALNDLSLYQQAMREYLSFCENAVDNAYVQFLDPKTNDVDVALAHLNKYVIIGMQTDLDESLQRWTKIALWSCREHPKATMIGRALTDPANVDSHLNFRDSSLLANSTGNELASPTIDELDLDLQQLIRTLTAGDEVIFRRAQELYEEQSHWFKMNHSEEDNDTLTTTNY